MKNKILFHLRGVAAGVLSLGALILTVVLLGGPQEEQKLPDGEYYAHEVHVSLKGLCVLIVDGPVNVIYTKANTCLDNEFAPGTVFVLKDEELVSYQNRT